MAVEQSAHRVGRWCPLRRIAGILPLAPAIEVGHGGIATQVVSLTNTVGAQYLAPAEILAPRIIRVGFSFDF